MKARELRLMAVALGGLALVVAARGGEAARQGGASAERASDAVVAGEGGGSASLTDQVREMVGSESIRLLDFTEIDQPGDVCDQAVEGSAPRTIRVSGGGSGVIDEARFAELTVDSDVSYGDLDGDGRDEAAVHTVCAYGANGVQDSIQVWDIEGGSARRVATLGDPPASLGQPFPPTVGDVTVEGGEVVVTWLHHQDDEPRCCPSLESSVRYAVDGDELRPIGTPETSRTD